MPRKSEETGNIRRGRRLQRDNQLQELAKKDRFYKLMLADRQMDFLILLYDYDHVGRNEIKNHLWQDIAKNLEITKEEE